MELLKHAKPLLLLIPAALAFAQESNIQSALKPPAKIQALTPRLPTMMATIQHLADQQHLGHWPLAPVVDSEVKDAPVSSSLLETVWENPEACWFFDQALNRWDAVAWFHSHRKEDGIEGARLVWVRDAFGPAPSLTPQCQPLSFQYSRTIQYRRLDGTGQMHWLSSDPVPNWTLAPYAYPMQEAGLLFTDVDYGFIFIYSPQFGVGYFGTYGMAVRSANPTGHLIGKDDLFQWVRTSKETAVRTKKGVIFSPFHTMIQDAP